MGLGGEKKGGGAQHKLLFDVYLRVDYRQQGNMDLGPSKVGKHKQKRKYQVPPPPAPTDSLPGCYKSIFIFKSGKKESHQTLLMQVAGDNFEVAALEKSPLPNVSGPSDAAWSLAPGFAANSGGGGGGAAPPLYASL